jgi:hypothetical protein
MALNFKLPLDLDDTPSAPSSFESQIQDLLRRDLRAPAQLPPVAAEATSAEATSAEAFVENLSSLSIEQVDRVIGELANMREALLAEAGRVQSELNAYSSISDSALRSARRVTDTLANWNQAPATKARIAAG